jgi:hypothetical protein
MHVGLLKVDNAQRRSQDATLKMFQNETIMSTGNVVSLSSEWPIEQNECLNCSTIEANRFRCGNSKSVQFGRFATSSRVFVSDNFKLIEIPLQGIEAVIQMIVPNDSEHLKVSLDDLQLLNSVNISMGSFVFPNLNVRCGKEFTEILTSMGLGVIFENYKQV